MSTVDMATVKDIFQECVGHLRGRVVDALEVEGRFYGRSVHHPAVEVSVGDALEGGVALRYGEGSVSVRPYLFRLLCTNGAVMAYSSSAQVIDIRGPAEESRRQVREAIWACAGDEAFGESVENLASTRHMRPDFGLAILALVRSHLGLSHRDLLQALKSAERWETGYDLANSLTAAARDHVDPETRWKLEEAGGGTHAWLKRALDSGLNAEEWSMPIGDRRKVLV